MIDIIEAMVRTNCYQASPYSGHTGKHYFSFKVDECYLFRSAWYLSKRYHFSDKRSLKPINPCLIYREFKKADFF